MLNVRAVDVPLVGKAGDQREAVLQFPAVPVFGWRKLWLWALGIVAKTAKAANIPSEIFKRNMGRPQCESARGGNGAQIPMTENIVDCDNLGEMVLQVFF